MFVIHLYTKPNAVIFESQFNRSRWINHVFDYKYSHIITKEYEPHIIVKTLHKLPLKKQFDLLETYKINQFNDWDMFIHMLINIKLIFSANINNFSNLQKSGCIILKHANALCLVYKGFVDT